MQGTRISRPTPGDICRWNCGINDAGAMENASARMMTRISNCIPCPSFGRIMDGRILCDKDYYFHEEIFHAIISPALLTHPHNGKTEIKMINGFVNAMLTITGILKHLAASILPHVLPTLSLESPEATGSWRCACDRDYLWEWVQIYTENPNCPPNSTPKLTEKIGFHICVIVTITKMRIKNVSIRLLAHQTLSQVLY